MDGFRESCCRPGLHRGLALVRLGSQEQELAVMRKWDAAGRVTVFDAAGEPSNRLSVLGALPKDVS